MFCRNCGSKMVAQAKFCANCGQPVDTPTGTAPVPNPSGCYTLTIHRVKQWFAVNPAIDVVVDGNAGYKIDNGCTLNIPVTAGTHKIAFSCGLRNRVVNIQVTDHTVLMVRWMRTTGSIKVE
ncbi:MAG: zinc ribbon domain-containing protein [Clostridia bacterium]|nr:zinc ribbon domain-containing protein [Clostridia bacterium]MDD7484304.1 zinc ribbon domain-containing protein [Clostridia bacterium]